MKATHEFPVQKAEDEAHRKRHREQHRLLDQHDERPHERLVDERAEGCRLFVERRPVAGVAGLSTEPPGFVLEADGGVLSPRASACAEVGGERRAPSRGE